MRFPYDQYATLAAAYPIYYPTGEESFARSVFQTLDGAMKQLSQLLQLDPPAMQVLLVATSDWNLAPRGESEEIEVPHPYWTDATTPATLVVPVEVDTTFGEVTPAKFAFMLYHELALAFLENDPRPWPADNPLWADEWQFKFAALWLAQRLDAQSGPVNQDLLEQYEELFEPEADGKTPVTIRGFDWYEDTTSEDYLQYELLLEKFAADLLATYDGDVLPRFLDLYRTERELLSDDVTLMLASALGPGGETWLEELVYF